MSKFLVDNTILLNRFSRLELKSSKTDLFSSKYHDLSIILKKHWMKNPAFSIIHKT